MTAALLCPEILTQIFECRQQDDIRPGREADLAVFSRVCRSWRDVAASVLYSDPSVPLCRLNGLFVPKFVKTLRKEPFLREAVKTLTITSTLEGGLWSRGGVYLSEGDLFADLVRICPNVRSITIPSFEISSRGNLLSALRSRVHMRHFTIRVYLESSRRNEKLAPVLPYDSYTLPMLTDLFAHWPNLKSFDVIHRPEDSYHLRPDEVLRPGVVGSELPAHHFGLTRLSLRETYINDDGLFHLLTNSRLTHLCLMSCQGITSSLISKAGLLTALKVCGPTLKSLEIMTPWLPTFRGDRPICLLDDALRNCTDLEHLTIAGYEVSDRVLHQLPCPQKLRYLGITDFEFVSPDLLLVNLHKRRLPNLRELGIWQRNLSNAGGLSRVTRGWFTAAFKEGSPLVAALKKHNVLTGTGWESRLIAGGDIEYVEADRTAISFEMSEMELHMDGAAMIIESL